MATGAAITSLRTRAIAAACTARKQANAARSMARLRPEWPIVTRVTMAMSIPPKNPMPSAWIGARPSAQSPLTTNAPSRTVCNSMATGSHAYPAYSDQRSGLPRALPDVQRTAHQAVSTNSAASTTTSAFSTPAVPSSKRSQASPTTAARIQVGRHGTYPGTTPCEKNGTMRWHTAKNTGSKKPHSAARTAKCSTKSLAVHSP